MDNRTLGEAARYASRIAHVEDGWISPLLEAIGDTDAPAARWKPSPEVASIWEILAHAMPYAARLLARASGEPVVKADDWPAVMDQSDEAWESFKAEAEGVVSRLQQKLDTLTDDQLAAPPAGLETPLAFIAIDISIHDSYHAGQIQKLLQAYRATAATAANSCTSGPRKSRGPVPNRRPVPFPFQAWTKRTRNGWSW